MLAQARNRIFVRSNGEAGHLSLPFLIEEDIANRIPVAKRILDFSLFSSIAPSESYDDSVVPVVLVSSAVLTRLQISCIFEPLGVIQMHKAWASTLNLIMFRLNAGKM